MRSITLENFKEPSYEMNEAMNVLRTNVSYSGESVKIVSITSVDENAGKSLISYEMMRNYANSGLKTLMIDADLRKSVLSARHGVTVDDGMPFCGLADVLSGKREINDVVYKTNIPNAYVLPVGNYVLNPTPLFSGKIFTTMLEVLQKAFDFIIIDTPPLGRVIDAAIIAPHCDGTMIIISANEVDYRQANEIKNQLMRVGANVLGCILNKVGQETAAYGKYGKKYGRYGKYGQYGQYGGKYQY